MPCLSVNPQEPDKTLVQLVARSLDTSVNYMGLLYHRGKCHNSTSSMMSNSLESCIYYVVHAYKGAQKKICLLSEKALRGGG